MKCPDRGVHVLHNRAQKYYSPYYFQILSVRYVQCLIYIIKREIAVKKGCYSRFIGFVEALIRSACEMNRFEVCFGQLLGRAKAGGLIKNSYDVATVAFPFFSQVVSYSLGLLYPFPEKSSKAGNVQ